MTQQTQRTREAAQTLFAARRERIDRLPAGCRPQSLHEAEAIQNAVLDLGADTIGAWKIGRAGEHIYSAPIPQASTLELDAAPTSFPPGTKIELELATRFRAPLDAGGIKRLAFQDLPELCNLVVLFEIVHSRYHEDGGFGELERIADGVSNLCVLTGPERDAWVLSDLVSPTATLEENGVQVTECEGKHPASPLEPLFTAWQARCEREGRGIVEGGIITWGSLSGIRPIPQGQVRYVGRFGDGTSIRWEFERD